MKTDLGTLIRNFFEQHLTAQRGLSPHTILAYRDTWKLFLQFVCRRLRRTCTKLAVENLTADSLRSFLDYLEKERRNSVPTRNARPAAIHAFFQYLASTDPRHLAHSQSILAVPFKRHAQRVPEYLEREEVLSIFGQINCAPLLGQRDDALLRLLYNSGMRAQELVDLDVNDLRFSQPYYVRIRGKGQRQRTCPLWKETVQSIKAYLARRAVRVDQPVPLFVNAEGNRLSRFGLRHIITHRVAEAAKTCPSLLTSVVSLN